MPTARTPMRGIFLVCCALTASGVTVTPITRTTAIPIRRMTTSVGMAGRSLAEGGGSQEARRVVEHGLVDYLVRLREHGLRDREIKGFGRLEVDDELELDWRLDRELERLCAPQDAIDIGSSTLIVIALVIPVGKQATHLRELTERIDRRYTVTSRQQCDRRAMHVHEGVWTYDKTTIPLTGLCGNDGVERRRIAHRDCDRLHSD